MYLGGQLETKIGPRYTSYIGASLISSGTYASSYCKSLSHLIFCQAIVGVGIGISYSAPILCGFKHFTNNKGIVTGVITTGTGSWSCAGYVPLLGTMTMYCILGFFGASLLFSPSSSEAMARTSSRFDETSLMRVENGEKTPLKEDNDNVDIYGEAMKQSSDHHHYDNDLDGGGDDGDDDLDDNDDNDI